MSELRDTAARKFIRRSIAVLGLAATLAAASAQSAFAASTPGTAETQIADFRYGSPRMGSTPRLPIPPPHRMRSGSGDMVAGPGRVALVRLMQLEVPATPTR